MYSDVHHAILAAFGEARAVYQKPSLAQDGSGDSDVSAQDMLAQDAMAHQLLKRTLSERQIAYLVMGYGPPEVFDQVAVPYYKANWQDLDRDFVLWCCREICGQPQNQGVTFREWALRLKQSKSRIHRQYMSVRDRLRAGIHEARKAAARELVDRGLIQEDAA